MDRAVDFATMLAGGSAVVVAAIVVVRAVSPPVSIQPAVEKQLENWERLTVGAQRMGPHDAPVTIIEFGDYQCPGCRAWQPHIEAVLRKYPNDVAFVFKHWPLSYHQLAYPAARAAECAGMQGRFWELHEILYANENWLGDALLRFGEDAGIESLDVFADCVAQTEAVPQIEASIAEALELDAPGTPTIIVNGLMLGERRDSAYLSSLIEEGIR